MYVTRSEYDHGVNTFSPEGRLFQVEYALEAIKQGTTAVGIQTRGGVVLAAERRASSPLLVAASVEKIFVVDRHIGAAASGITADARTMVDYARVEAQNHWFSYNEVLPVESCAQALSDVAMSFGQKKRNGPKMSRPFGVALLLGGIDDNGPSLYHTDPSGTYVRYLAKAIGAGCEGAQQTLEEKYDKSMELDDAVKLALEVLKQVMEERISSSNIELSIIRTESPVFKSLTKDEIDALLATL